MQKPASFIIALFSILSLAGQTSNQRPKLVVGIVVDQMRWDYLYRYYDRYAADGGFKRLLNKGFSCENTMIPYAPTVTACGHAGIYTGSVPAIHGIIGNGWWSSQLNTSIYCTQDDSVKTVGSTTTAGQMSPVHLLTTTITDELRLATNFKSKVIGVALKDRGSILPAGHSANAAYWYDTKTGDWITSTYYMNDLPQWVKDFNAKKLVDKYYAEDWSTLYPLNTYKQSTEDDRPYENRPFGAGTNFPYNLKKFAGTNSYSYISVTPQGNTFTLEMAKAALTAEQLGKDSVTDFLAVSLSSPDYIGHTFGPNSVEAEDGFLRLDKSLGEFLNFLNSTVGEGQYLLFLSADHGAAHVPGFLKEHKIPAGNMDAEGLYTDLNKSLKEKFGVDELVVEISNCQVYLNHKLITTSKLNKKDILQWVIDYSSDYPGIDRAFESAALASTTLNATIKEIIANGYNASRSGDIQLIFKPQWIEGFKAGGTSHGLWNPYDAHIPLLWYGWNIKPGKLNRQTYMTDIAPTIAAMLHIQMPSGSIGHVIEEVTK
jgi:predicted AlkP superfamily pyrophosphatase or phosphodiesterase